MIFCCPQCQTRYNVDDQQLQQYSKVHCVHCQYEFVPEPLPEETSGFASPDQAQPNAAEPEAPATAAAGDSDSSPQETESDFGDLDFDDLEDLAAPEPQQKAEAGPAETAATGPTTAATAEPAPAPPSTTSDSDSQWEAALEEEADIWQPPAETTATSAAAQEPDAADAAEAKEDSYPEQDAGSFKPLSTADENLASDSKTSSPQAKATTGFEFAPKTSMGENYADDGQEDKGFTFEPLTSPRLENAATSSHTAEEDAPPFAAEQQVPPAAGSPKSAPAPKKTPPKRRSRLGLWLLLLVLALGTGYGYLGYRHGSFQPQQIWQQLQQMLPLEQTPSSPAEMLRIQEETSYYLDHPQKGTLFVIQGKLQNTSSSSLSSLRVQGTLLAQNGQQIAQKTSYCGNVMDKSRLRKLSWQEIEKRMSNEFGSMLTNTEVPAGESLAFTLVYADLTQNPAEYVLQPAKATPAGK